MFKRIDHIELLTAQPQRAIDFYTGVLGFRVRAERVPDLLPYPHVVMLAQRER